MTTSNRELLFLVPGVQPGETREDFAKRAAAAAREAGVFEGRRRRKEETRGRLAPRVDESNPDHHLWNNNGTWWFHCTVHHPDNTTERVRYSLNTRDLRIARLRRDEILEKGGKS